MLAMDPQSSFLINLEILIAGTAVLLLAVLGCVVRGCFHKDHSANKQQTKHV